MAAKAIKAAAVPVGRRRQHQCPNINPATLSVRTTHVPVRTCNGQVGRSGWLQSMEADPQAVEKSIDDEVPESVTDVRLLER